MNFEQIPKDSNQENNQSEILKQNVNTLIELFELNDREGKFSFNQRAADRITSIIQKHTEQVEGGYNRIGDAANFLEDIRKAKEKMIEEIVDENEKRKISDLFAKVDIPDLDLGTALTPGDSERNISGKRVGRPGGSFAETRVDEETEEDKKRKL